MTPNYIFYSDINLKNISNYSYISFLNIISAEKILSKAVKNHFIPHLNDIYFTFGIPLT